MPSYVGWLVARTYVPSIFSRVSHVCMHACFSPTGKQVFILTTTPTTYMQVVVVVFIRSFSGLAGFSRAARSVGLYSRYSNLTFGSLAFSLFFQIVKSSAKRFWKN